MKNYVIIGGSSGIGKALVELLKETDANLFVSYNENELQSGDRLHCFKHDVESDEINSEHFPDEIHGLVYCPGTINLKPFHRFKSEDFMEDFKIQVVGAVNVIQAILPRLKNAKNASIVFISSIAAQQGFNFHSQVAASKGAIEGLTKSLAAEFAPNIRVNAVAPSLTDTPLAERFLNSPEKRTVQANANPLKKIGEANDIAEAIAFLISPKSAWITGQIIHIDGGFSSIK